MGGVANSVGGLVSGIMGGAGTAGAMGQSAAGAYAQEMADRAYIMPTQAEQDQLKDALAVNTQSIQQSQKLLASADPAMIQAGVQALQLMQGKEAAGLAPLKNQRAQQRAQLEQQLAQQLGPGYRTSSAGIQALNNFDQQSANVMNQAQQGAIGEYMGFAQNARNMGSSQQQQGIQNEQAITQQGQNMRSEAVRGAQINGSLPYAGQLANAQANQAGMGMLLSGAGGAMGGMGGMAGTFGKFAQGASGQEVSETAGIGKYAGGRIPQLHLVQGGMVPGEANYPDIDHPANDTIKAMLSPGEGVIPLTHMKSKQKAVKYVMSELFGKKGNTVKKGKGAYNGRDNSKLTMARQADPDAMPVAKDLSTDTSAMRGPNKNAFNYPAAMPEADRHVLAFEQDPRKIASVEAKWNLPHDASIKAYQNVAPEYQTQIAQQMPASWHQQMQTQPATMQQLRAGQGPSNVGEQQEEGHWKGGKVRPDPEDVRHPRGKYNKGRRKMYA